MRHLSSIIVLACVCGVGTIAGGAPPAGTASRPAEMTETRIDPRVARALSTPFEGFTWEKVPLTAVFADIQSKAGANVVVDWRSLKEGVEAKTLITLTAKQATLEELLDLISHTSEMSENLGCHVVGGNIVITTRDVAERSVMARAYEIADLIVAETAPAMAAARAQAKAEGASAGGGGGLFGSERASGKDLDEANAKLMAAIALSVDRESWTTVGSHPWAAAGPSARGSIAVFSSKLVVTCTERNQKKVAALLEELREKKAGK